MPFDAVMLLVAFRMVVLLVFTMDAGLVMLAIAITQFTRTE